MRHMNEKLDRQVCIVLGRALLWRIFDESGDVVPEAIRVRVMAAYADLGDDHHVEEGVNPIMKVAIGVDGVDAELVVDTLFEDDNEADGADRNGRRVRRRIERQEIQFLRSQIMHLRRQQDEALIQLARRDDKHEQLLQRINRNIIRIANTPLRHHVNAPVAEDVNVAPNLNVDEGNQEQRLVATLTKTPRTLHALWQEYEIGGPGRKPVKDWTAQERGRHKHSVYKRKFFWNKVSEMVRAGIEANC